MRCSPTGRSCLLCWASKVARTAGAVAAAVAVLVAVFIGLRALDGSGAQEQLRAAAENLPAPGPEARVISTEVGPTEATVIYRLPLTSNPLSVAQNLADRFEDQGWVVVSNPRLVDSPEGSTEALFTANREELRATVRTVSQASDFTVTTVLTEAGT